MTESSQGVITETIPEAMVPAQTEVADPPAATEEQKGEPKAISARAIGALESTRHGSPIPDAPFRNFGQNLD